LDQIYYDRCEDAAGARISTNFTVQPLLYPCSSRLYKVSDRREWIWPAVQHCSVGTGLLVACLARVCFSIALAACRRLLFLLAPVPLYFEGELLIEPSYIFLICAGLLLVLRAARLPDGRGALWLLSGSLTVLTAQRVRTFSFHGVYPLFAAWRGAGANGIRFDAVSVGGRLAMATPWDL